MRIRIALLFLGLVLAACSSPGIQGPTLIPVPPVPEWLLKPACTLPCWENITPQSTRFKDTLSILDQNGIQGTRSSTTEISVQLEGTTVGIIGSEEGSVSAVVLVPPRDAVTLDQLIAHLSWPKEVYVALEPRDASRCNAALLFVQGGAVAEAYWDNTSDNGTTCTVDITDRSAIFRLILVGPDVQTTEYWTAGSPSSQTTPWKGWGVYP